MLAPETIDEAAENWIVAFQGEPADALAQLVTFVLRLCGSDAHVDASHVGVDALSDTLESIQEAFAQVCLGFFIRTLTQHAVGQYPIISRAKALRGVRKQAAHLWERLLHGAAEAEVVGDEDFLGTLQAWLCELAQSALRPFRHTATVVALWILGGLSAQVEAARDSFQVAERQRDAEAKKTGANRSRVAHTEQRMEQLDALRDTLDGHVDDLVTNVFVPRVRDVDALIRVDCIEQLGMLLKQFPTEYLQEFYFRHLGTALSDPDSGVRLRAVRAAHGVCTAAHADALRPFFDAYKKRLLDMALYDLDLGVRTAAFALLEAANAHRLLEQEDCSVLAVHVFDMDARIRTAAAAFLVTLLEQQDGNEPQARLRALVALLVQYNAQLEQAEQRLSEPPIDDEGLLVPTTGRIGVATEALWDTEAALHNWQPYLDLLLADLELTPEEEAVAVEMFVAVVRLTRERGIEEEGVFPIEALSHALISTLPKLLARFSAETERISDLLLVLQWMDLGVYHETRNMTAFDALWDDVCAHFLRHVDRQLLHNAAEALQRLAGAPAAVSTRAAKLATLQETILGTLQDTLHQRTIDTALFTEDDVHTIYASLARLHALVKTMDVAQVLDEAPQGTSNFHTLLALAKRGRLAYDQERPFVCLALKILTLYILWRTNEAPDSPADVDLIQMRCTELHAILEAYLSGAEEQLVSTVRPWLTQSLQCTLLLYTLSAALQGDEKRAALYLTCPPTVQRKCATAMHAELERFLPTFREEAEQAAKSSKRATRRTPRASSTPGTTLHLLYTGLHLCALASAYVTAIRVGALDVRYSATLFRYYGQCNADYDALCHELVTVLRDDALHAGRAWVVCETIVDALKEVRALLTPRRASSSTCCMQTSAARRISSHSPVSSQMPPWYAVLVSPWSKPSKRMQWSHCTSPAYSKCCSTSRRVRVTRDTNLHSLKASPSCSPPCHPLTP